MSLKLTQEDVEAIFATPKPAEAAFPKKAWPAIGNRILALDNMLEGSPMNAVSKSCRIDRKTLRRMMELALQRGEDGSRIGYFSCVPNKRFAPPTPHQIEVPKKGHAFALEMVLRAIPTIAEKIHSFKGGLPTRERRSPAFNRLYASIRSVLKESGHADSYPLNTFDEGRRAIQAYLKRYRARLAADSAADLPETPSITRIEHIFTLKPFDRVEFDEHYIDVDAWVAFPLADGTFRLEKISRIWILVIVDVGSGAILAWSLVVGRKYHRLDVLNVFAKALRPWSPRELLVPGMRYSPRAWMPSCYLEDDLVPRSLMAALDNDSAHISDMALENLADYHLGILHYGRSGMGQGRAYVEALFKLVENELLRYIAGGYTPETRQARKTKVSTLSGDRYPVLIEILEDLIDIYFSAHNVTSRSTREPRSPKDLIDDHLASGALLWRCPSSEEHARRLTVKRMTVTIRGSRAKKVPPLVYQDHARYRSPQLTAQWPLVGQEFAASYENPDDIRELTLWNIDGSRALTLHALPPYSAISHPLSTRVRAAAWCRSRPARSAHLEETQDNIVAYHAAVRAAASKLRWASDLIASGEVPARSPDAARTSSDQPTPLSGIRPLPNLFSFR